MLVALGEKDIKTLDDFAGLAGDELLELLAASDKGGAALDPEAANALIMRARAHWFDDQPAAAAARRAGVGATAVGDDAALPRRDAGGGRRRAAPPLHRDRRDPRPRRCCCGLSSVPAARLCPMLRRACPDGVCG